MEGSLCEFAYDACCFLQRHEWCRSIHNHELVLAVPGFLGITYCSIQHSRADDFVWVITGDLPSLYFGSECRTPANIIEAYIVELERWCEAQLCNSEQADIMPMPGPRSSDFLAAIRNRVGFIRSAVVGALQSSVPQISEPRHLDLPCLRPLRETNPMNWFAIRDDIHAVNWIRERELYYQEHFGPLAEDVFDDASEEFPHVDIYAVRPTVRKMPWLLVTSGMSNWPQEASAPHSVTLYVRRELIAYASRPDSSCASVLHELSKMSFRRAESLRDCEIVSMATRDRDQFYLFIPLHLLLGVQIRRDDLASLIIDRDEVAILLVASITESEKRYASQKGGRALAHLLLDGKVDLCIDKGRKSVA